MEKTFELRRIYDNFENELGIANYLLNDNERIKAVHAAEEKFDMEYTKYFAKFHYDYEDSFLQINRKYEELILRVLEEYPNGLTIEECNKIVFPKSTAKNIEKNANSAYDELLFVFKKIKYARRGYDLNRERVVKLVK